MVKNKEIKVKRINKILIAVIIVVYCIALLIIIQWGLPNPDRPFPFQMDEWHQLRGVATLAKDYSNNVPGSGHGTMLHFILSAIYLSPFYFLHIIHPANLKHNLSPAALSEYTRIFEILRIYILIFGVGTLLLIYKISTKYIKVNPVIAILLFAATPAFTQWSNVYKYELPVLFWITCSLLFLLRYQIKPTRKRFILASIICGLAFSTKISALPLLPTLVIAFLLFTPKFKKHIVTFFWGIVAYIVTVCLVGIPDILLEKGDYGGFLNDNIGAGPQGGSNLILNYIQTHFFVFEQIPFDFGFGIAALMIFAFVYYIIIFVKAFKSKKIYMYKTEIFLLCGFSLFLISFIPIKYFVSSNRMLVILPFIVFLIMIALQNSFLKKNKILFFVVTFFIIVLQVFQTFTVYSIKLAPDQQVTSSAWITTHIPKGATIGLNNIPIYQMIPDILLSDFYNQVYKDNKAKLYNYIIIDSPKVKLPKYIVLTNAHYENTYLKTSVKKTVLQRMAKEHYKLIASFSPDMQLYNLFGNESDYNLSGPLPAWPITIYEKGK
jgi:hypothetical protein